MNPEQITTRATIAELRAGGRRSAGRRRGRPTASRRSACPARSWRRNAEPDGASGLRLQRAPRQIDRE